VWFSKGKDQGRINSSFYSFTSGTSLTLVYQDTPAISSTPTPNLRDFERQTGLSPSAAYLATPWELTANKGNLRPKHHVYIIDYYSSIAQGYPVFIKGPVLEYPLQEWTMNP
jgi:hypothetical protein